MGADSLDDRKHYSVARETQHDLNSFCGEKLPTGINQEDPDEDTDRLLLALLQPLILTTVLQIL